MDIGLQQLGHEWYCQPTPDSFQIKQETGFRTTDFIETGTTIISGSARENWAI